MSLDTAIAVSAAAIALVVGVVTSAVSAGSVLLEWKEDLTRALPEFLVPYSSHDLTGALPESTRPIVFMG